MGACVSLNPGMAAVGAGTLAIGGMTANVDKDKDKKRLAREAREEDRRQEVLARLRAKELYNVKPAQIKIVEVKKDNSDAKEKSPAQTQIAVGNDNIQKIPYNPVKAPEIKFRKPSASQTEISRPKNEELIVRRIPLDEKRSTDYNSDEKGKNPTNRAKSKRSIDIKEPVNSKMTRSNTVPSNATVPGKDSWSTRYSAVSNQLDFLQNARTDAVIRGNASKLADVK